MSLLTISKKKNKKKKQSSYLLAGQLPEKYDGMKFEKKIVLIGAAPHHPGALGQLYRDIDSFHRTEIFEFALQQPLPHFQPFKLQHARFLADLGFVSEAFRYAPSFVRFLFNFGKTNNFLSLFSISLSRYCEAIGAVVNQVQQNKNTPQGLRLFSERFLSTFTEFDHQLRKLKSVESMFELLLLFLIFYSPF